MKILLIKSNIYGKHICTNKLQDIIKTQDPSTQSFQGTRSEDRIVCKMGFVVSSKHYQLYRQPAYIVLVLST